MDLFRALKRTHGGEVELSERALALTEHLVRINPAIYTVWNYRSAVLVKMGQQEGAKSRLVSELDFLDSLAHENMKNYQVWCVGMRRLTLHARQHRRLIVSALGDPSRELAFTADNLSLDSKNYHTWAYRQWVLSYFGGMGGSVASSSVGAGMGAYPHLWDGELDYVEQMLDEDVRNNSAWNHRWFCVFSRNAGNRKGDALDQARTDEIACVCACCGEAHIRYTFRRISDAPSNMSAWNYLRGCVAVRRGSNPQHTPRRWRPHTPAPVGSRGAGILAEQGPLRSGG